MHISCAAVITLLSFYAATVSSSSTEKRILRVPIQRRSQPDPIISSQLKKYGKRDSYISTLFNDLGSQYLINVSIGTPGQNFTVTLDTGSADLWVPGNTCPAADCPNNLFDPSASSTYKSLNQPFTLTYGIGNVNGTYATDTITVAGATIQNQQFGLASDTKQILTNPSTITVSSENALSKRDDTPKANGILGLGYPRLTAASSKGQGPYNPFVFNLAAQNVISDPIFSIYLNNANTDGWVGEVIFGGTDQTKFKGNLTYLPVVPLSSVAKASKKRATLNTGGNYYWMVNAHGVAVTYTNSTSSSDTGIINTTATTNSSNAAVSLSFNATSAFILDTGTTLTYLPSSMAEQIITAMAGADGFTTDASSGTYLVNCEAATSNTQLELIMSDGKKNSVSLSVPASQLVIPLDGKTAATSKSCLFGIAPTGSTVGNNMYLVGDSILRSAYLVFDMGNNQVGIAAAMGVAGNVQGSSFSFSTPTSSDGQSRYQQSTVMFALVSCLLLVFMS